ncbi:site-specific integrase [Acidithiobacillus sulfurivorans]|uniref:Tyrosine-type recombinase/integrase n=1 Tax=Acidithiobacillus sulfurivorans TaxID=1958756 RepID=A0ABS5ZWI3_9PROT|nr:site-specific integrase [Acidithiobacillus sulfurivorans]MBU2759578.1 tyrosine-type recombinase/integrase [Acidithiobacillus sulfurivorans]
MFLDDSLSHIPHPDWLSDGPLTPLVPPFITRLRSQHYADRTVIAYVNCLAHFGFWLKNKGLEQSSISPALIKRFLQHHLPNCHCPAPCRSAGSDMPAALKHLLKCFPQNGISQPTIAEPIARELERFGAYLSNTCGVAPVTRNRRMHDIGAFLSHQFGEQAPVTAQISGEQLEAYISQLGSHLRPASLRTVCNSLRSYLRYRALLGEPTAVLSNALPKIADWRHTALPKVLSDKELSAFLVAFDCTDPMGQRDYAIARCLVDLGLRGQEVTDLTLESIDWRRAVLTINGTKSKRVQKLPLPEFTGEAIAQYLRHGRPQTNNRLLFVRHRAPFGISLSVSAIRNSMNRAFVRCGLRDRYCNTHVLRRTAATRLQQAGTSVKAIADILRHQSLDTVRVYVRVDLDTLRAVALPWPGGQS